MSYAATGWFGADSTSSYAVAAAQRDLDAAKSALQAADASLASALKAAAGNPNAPWLSGAQSFYDKANATYQTALNKYVTLSQSVTKSEDGSSGQDVSVSITVPLVGGKIPTSQDDCPSGTYFESWDRTGYLPGGACKKPTQQASAFSLLNKSLTDFWDAGILNKAAIVGGGALLLWGVSRLFVKRPMTPNRSRRYRRNAYRVIGPTGAKSKLLFSTYHEASEHGDRQFGDKNFIVEYVFQANRRRYGKLVQNRRGIRRRRLA